MKIGQGLNLLGLLAYLYRVEKRRRLEAGMDIIGGGGRSRSRVKGPCFVLGGREILIKVTYSKDYGVHRA